jgi:hypothetical protein
MTAHLPVRQTLSVLGTHWISILFKYVEEERGDRYKKVSRELILVCIYPQNTTRSPNHTEKKILTNINKKQHFRFHIFSTFFLSGEVQNA